MEGARARGAQRRLGRARSAGGTRRGAGAQQVPVAGGWLGRGVRAEPGQRTRTSRLVRIAGQLPRVGPPHLALQLEPCTDGTPGSSPSGARPPQRSGPGRRLSSSLARGWPQAPPTAHIWKEFEGEWEGEVEGRQRATGNVGVRWNWGGACTPVPRARAQPMSTSLIPASPYFDPFTDRDTDV